MAISKTETLAASPETGPGVMLGAQALHEQLAPACLIGPTGPAPSPHRHGFKIHFLLDQ